jgi:hypothetical protein
LKEKMSQQTVDLNNLAEQLEKLDWSVFRDESSRFIAKNAIAILYHIIKHDKSSYGIDGSYLLEKASKIVDELAA